MSAFIVEVRVHPRARQEAIQPILEEGQQPPRKWEAWTREPPEAGRANEAVRRLLAKALGISAAQVELLRGRTSRQKTFRVLLP